MVNVIPDNQRMQPQSTDPSDVIVPLGIRGWHGGPFGGNVGSMAGEIRVVVADRRRSVAEILALGLRQVGMVGSAVTGMKAACRAAAEGRADVVVADIGLLAAPDALAAESPWPRQLAVPLIVLSDGTRTDDLACAAIRAGVRGWVPKDSSMQHLLAVIRGCSAARPGFRPGFSPACSPSW